MRHVRKKRHMVETIEERNEKTTNHQKGAAKPLGGKS
jgi:hypothetical protein